MQLISRRLRINCMDYPRPTHFFFGPCNYFARTAKKIWASHKTKRNEQNSFLGQADLAIRGFLTKIREAGWFWLFSVGVLRKSLPQVLSQWNASPLWLIQTAMLPWYPHAEIRFRRLLAWLALCMTSGISQPCRSSEVLSSNKFQSIPKSHPLWSWSHRLRTQWFPDNKILLSSPTNYSEETLMFSTPNEHHWVCWNVTDLSQDNPFYSLSFQTERKMFNPPLFYPLPCPGLWAPRMWHEVRELCDWFSRNASASSRGKRHRLQNLPRPKEGKRGQPQWNNCWDCQITKEGLHTSYFPWIWATIERRSHKLFLFSIVHVHVLPEIEAQLEQKPEHFHQI